MVSCSNLFHIRGLLGSVIIYACFSDGGLMCTQTAMCESGHCRDKIWPFCLHLSVMLLVVILSYLITKWIIVMNTKKMNCLTNFPNEHFFFSTVRYQLMWTLESRLCKSFRGSISCPLLPIYFTPLTCIFNVLFPLQTSAKFSSKKLLQSSFVYFLSCLVSCKSQAYMGSELAIAGFSSIFIPPPAFLFPSFSFSVIFIYVFDIFQFL